MCTDNKPVQSSKKQQWGCLTGTLSWEGNSHDGWQATKGVCVYCVFLPGLFWSGPQC